jgi:hypothetical protein
MRFGRRVSVENRPEGAIMSSATTNPTPIPAAPLPDGPAVAIPTLDEIWRFDGERAQVIIERLGNDGSYHPVEASGFLPVRTDDVRRWVVDEDADNESAWARRLRAWVHDELFSRRTGTIPS